MAKWRLPLLLWCLGMAGVVSLTLLVLPELLTTLPKKLGKPAPPIPIWVLLLASLAQSSVLLGLTVWLGSVLAPKVGLDAPVLAALVERRPFAPLLRPQLLSGAIGGVMGGAVLVAFSSFAPPAIKAVQKTFEIPFIARLLYGGITEEILLRWGLMTLFVWVPWRIWQDRDARPKTIFFVLAIVISAVVFGAGHLPAAKMLIGELTTVVVVWVIAANALFGVMVGYLYWRYGLEAAMLAHAIAHGIGFVLL